MPPRNTTAQHWEDQYIDLMRRILTQREVREGRNGAWRSIFGERLVIDVGEVFPMLTTRQIGLGFVAEELDWFLSGSTETADASAAVKRLWYAWTREALCDAEQAEGRAHKSSRATWEAATSIGWSYGRILRGLHSGSWRADRPDQLHDLVKGLIQDPHGRRHLTTTWDPGAMAYQRAMGMLTTCHGTATQCYIDGDRLHMRTYQRSADVPVGLPYNLASYALWLHQIAHLVGKRPGVMYYDLGDAHIYEDQRDLAKEHATRTPLEPPTFALAQAQDPQHFLSAPRQAWPFTPQDATLEGYRHLGKIAYPVSV